jgi:hypothetical protein
LTVIRKSFVERFGAAMAGIALTPLPFGIGNRYPVFYRLEDAFVLMLVLEFSTRNSGAVTASWCLGATFQWGVIPDGVGYRVYRRVPTLLTMADRQELIGPEDVVAEGFDYWWPSLDERILTALSEAVRRTEPRFLAQAPKNELRRSSYYKERRELVARVRAHVPGPPPLLRGLQEEAAMRAWLTAAERVASTDDRIHHSKKSIRALAEDAAASAAVGIVL